jgi:hypothetical protein
VNKGVLYLDSSALLKLVFEEDETQPLGGSCLARIHLVDLDAPTIRRAIDVNPRARPGSRCGRPPDR